MSEPQRPHPPFKTLGNHLKYLREQSQESLGEVSGAVEIDEKVLTRIENGLERPAEDILMLLINHFEMQDREAVQLWELAGYIDYPQPKVEDGSDTSKSVVMLLALDTRTIYSDGLDIACNQAGLTFNFTQSTGATQVSTVARVGMSYEQAEMVAKTLQQALLQARYNSGPKILPPSTSSSEGKK